MTPYYQDDTATIYHGDCQAILPSLGMFDLLLTDPPYGISYVHGGGGGKLAKSTCFGSVQIAGDDKKFSPESFLRFDKTILWGANHFADLLPASRGWLCWDKRGGMKSNDQSDCELAWTSFLTVARLKTLVWNGMITSGEQRGKPRCHPTQKPIELMRWCLSFAPDARTILDPFMGSGTTLVAARLEGRIAVGIELEERYCEIAAKRLSQQVLF